MLKSCSPANPAAPPAPAGRLLAGPIVLDLRRRELLVHERPVALTAAEMRVLAELLRRQGEVISRAELTQLALERPLEAYDRSIDTLASRLRRKLAGAGLPVQVIRGLRGHTTGYAVPTDVIDAPGGGGKFHLLTDNFEGM